jgi:hypothetical protein
MSYHSKKRASKTITPTTILSKPWPREAEPEPESAVEAELATEEPELALPAAVADGDAKLLLLEMLARAEEVETEDCEAVSAAVIEARDTLLEPLPFVEVAAAATASNCQRRSHECTNMTTHWRSRCPARK